MLNVTSGIGICREMFLMKRMWRASRPSAAWFAAAPKAAVGVLLIVLGLVFAKLIEVALRYILIRIRFDTDGASRQSTEGFSGSGFASNSISSSRGWSIS